MIAGAICYNINMETILTGIRVNEEPTLGNFLGAYLPMIQQAKQHAGKYNINMFIPDLHSFTTPINHATFYEQIIKGVKYYMAAGLDTENPHIYVYRQSRVPAHAELAWILDCFTYFGEAARMIQFKEKSLENKENVTVGLFNYPILMAADILLYDAKYVPLGEDQFQHLELCRDIALRFNKKFKQEVFTLPASEQEQVRFMGLERALRIRSLTDPTKKMSKSDANQKAKISLSDDPAAAKQKIMAAKTDSLGLIKYDIFNQAGLANLMTIEAALSGLSLQDVVSRWSGEHSYGEFKQKVADTVAGFLTDFQAKVAAISDDEVEAVLERGEAFARQKSQQKLELVQQVLGLRP